MKMWKIFCLCILFPVAAFAAEPRVSGVGGAGVLVNLNDRMADGVSSVAPALSGTGEITLSGFLGAWDARAALGLDAALFPGTAFVGDVSLQLGAARRFSFLSMPWEAAVCAGPALTLAPTRDAGSLWVSTFLRFDFRCEFCPLKAGLYLKIQQIWMSGVADPWMLGAGLSVRFDFLGRSKPVEADSLPKPAASAVDPEDEDGDGVIKNADRCPHSLPSAKVQTNGCEAVADGMPFSAQAFVDGADVLTPAGERECLRVAELLAANAQLAVVLQVAAATDALAQARFAAISRRLQELGVPAARILSETRAQPAESITLSFRLLLQ